MKYWDEKNKRLLTEEEMSQVNPVAYTSEDTQEDAEEISDGSQSDTSEDVEEKKEDKKKTSRKKQGDAQ